MLKKGRLCEIGKGEGESISGRKPVSFFQGDALRIGEFVVRSPIFAEASGSVPNILGLEFLSCFVATFDFPEQALPSEISSF